MSKKELKAKIEALEARVAMLEAQSVRVVPFGDSGTPFWRIRYDQRGPQCGGVTSADMPSITTVTPGPSSVEADGEKYWIWNTGMHTVEFS